MKLSEEYIRMKLNQILAIEKEVKTRVYSEITALHKACQKPALFNGFTKAYNRKSEDGEEYPTEVQYIQQRADTAISDLCAKLAELFDIVAAKDAANRQASADVRDEHGDVLLTAVPATTLLFLEKQLNDIRTFVEALPVLEGTERWELDSTTGHYRTAPTQTSRTKKIARPIVLYPATVEHPAQTQLITEDVIVGYWDQVKISAAIPPQVKQRYLDKINALSKSVKQAREEANLVVAPEIKIGETIFKHLFG